MREGHSLVRGLPEEMTLEISLEQGMQLTQKRVGWKTCTEKTACVDPVLVLGYLAYEEQQKVARWSGVWRVLGGGSG